MCGIAGFFTFEDVPNGDSETIFAIAEKLFIETNDRGKDASGFSYINRFNELDTIKGPVSSDKIVLSNKWARLKENMPKLMIMHTRSMTLGSPANNFNNHPLVVDKEISVAHNGMISNHSELKKAFDLRTKGQVDSEVIPYLIKKGIDSQLLGGDTLRPRVVAKAINFASGELIGGFACAMLHKLLPDSLFLFTHANPTVLAYCDTLKTVFFASEKEHIDNAFNVKENSKMAFGVFPVRKHNFSPKRISDNTITVMGLKKEKEITVGEKPKSEFSLEFFDLDYVSSGVTHIEEKTKIKINGLKKKNGLNDSRYMPTELEDWESATSCGV